MKIPEFIHHLPRIKYGAGYNLLPSREKRERGIFNKMTFISAVERFQ